MSARETPELLLLVVRLVQAEGYDGQLSPIPMDGAPLLRPCQSVLPNPSAIAEFQATTRGTATQTIKALEAGGFVVRRRSAADGRSVSFRLTGKGNKAVARDPFEVLVRAVNSLDAEEQTAMHHALHQVLTTVAASGAHRRFGVCQDCAHLGGETCCGATSATLSDGSFVYAPPGVRCPMELSTYFRVNEAYTGQFERTLIIADKVAYVSYLEGCTAPIRAAEIKYSTVQNWYPGDADGKGGIFDFVTKRGDCRGKNSKISWTRVETGSAITWNIRAASCGATARGANSIRSRFPTAVSRSIGNCPGEC